MPKRLTNAELYYLAENPGNLSAKELAKELGFHENIIKKYLKPKTEKAEVVIEKPKPRVIPADENADDKFGRRFDKHGQIIASVMTPGASQVGDVARDKLGPSHLRLKDSLKSAIHQPKGGKSSKPVDYEKVALELSQQIEQLKKELADKNG